MIPDEITEIRNTGRRNVCKLCACPGMFVLSQEIVKKYSKGSLMTHGIIQTLFCGLNLPQVTEKALKTYEELKV